MTHEELIEVVEKSRSQRGALGVVREAGSLLERRPRISAQLEKLLQEWTEPRPIDRAVRLAVEALECEGALAPNVVRAKELMSALLLATGERAAEHERKAKRGGVSAR